MGKKLQSALTEDLEHCFVCGSPYVQIHHVIYGRGKRKLSDKYKYILPLCREHHTGDSGVHKNPALDLKLKLIAQEHFLSTYGTREEFINTFGRAY